MRILEYTIEDAKNVKDFLREKKYPSKMLSILKRTDDGIMVNGRCVYTNYKLSVGDKLLIKIKEEESSENIPENDVPFDIIFEDLDLMVINKPPKVASHPSFNHFDSSLASGIKKYLNSSDFVYRCINRLDKDTSGLLIIAKNRLSAGILIEELKNKKIKRKYLAIVKGELKNQNGYIEAPIARDLNSIIKREVCFNRGDYAKTNFEVLAYTNGYTLLKLQLETGRTHQIRVHLKHIEHPIIGDFLYNPDFTKIDRQALHSTSLEFIHPITFEKMSFYADMPKDMKEVFKKTCN